MRTVACSPKGAFGEYKTCYKAGAIAREYVNLFNADWVRFRFPPNQVGSGRNLRA